MTVQQTTNRWQYVTNGTTGPWTVGAYFIAEDDLVVTYTDADGNDLVLDLGADYTVTGAGDAFGGTVTTTEAYAAGGKITIVNDPEALQEADYSETDSFPAATHERALDKLTFLIQRALLSLERCIRAPDSDGAMAELPGAAARAGMLQGYSLTGASSLYPVTSTYTGSSERISVKALGATGLGSVSDNLAFEVAFSACVALATGGGGAALYIPTGIYRLTEPLNWYRASSPRVDIEVFGDGQFSSVLKCDFYGADEALISVRDPLGVSRASPISFYDLGFEHASTSGGVNPVFIDVLGWGESRMRGVRFSSTNNTVMRAMSSQNVRMYDVVSFYGGRHFNYKDTSGITFNVDSGTKTITASASIFTAGDTGKFFFIHPSDANRRIRYTLTYVDATHATFTESGLTETAASGFFEPARASINNGSKRVTANASVFTSDMVGMVLCIRKAAAGSYGSAILRSRIAAYVSATQVDLDDAATATVSSEFMGVPAFDFGVQGSFAGSSDVRMEALHIEHYRGVALLLQNVDTYYIHGKIHGETTPSASAMSHAAIWADDADAEYRGWLDSTCSMSDCRVYACNQNSTLLLNCWTRGVINGTVIKTELFSNSGGRVLVPFLHSTIDFADPWTMVSDANYAADATDPRVQLREVDMLGDAQSPRLYVGRRGYFTPLGRYVSTDSPADTVLASTVTWDGTAPSGTAAKHYIWERHGRLVTFAFRLEYATAGVTNSSVTIAKPSDMPAPIELVGVDSTEILGFVATGHLGTSATNISLSKPVILDDGASGWNFGVYLNSGTISAKFAEISGTYFTNDP